MASNIITVNGDDLDDLFAPINGTTPRALTGILVGTEDIAYRYRASSTELDRVELPTLILGLDGTGAGVVADLQAMFRNINYVSGFSFVTHPQQTITTVGQSLSFYVTVQENVGTVTYQWQKAPVGTENYVNIVGATNSTYTIASAAAGDQALYRCIATDSDTPTPTVITSLGAFGAVYVLPSFTSHPTGSTQANGTLITLTATFDPGNPASGFGTGRNWGFSPTGGGLWLAVGAPTYLVTISGNTMTLQFTLTEETAGFYRATVYNDAGSVNSNAAQMIVFQTIPASILYSYFDPSVAAGTPIELNVTAQGTAPISYQWKKNGVSLGSAYGAQTPNFFKNTSVLGDSGTYSCYVSNAYGDDEVSGYVNVYQPESVPILQQSPTSQSVQQGATVTMSCSFSGLPAPEYQWYFNNNPIPGATSSVLTLYGVDNGDEGTYYCEGSNYLGSINTNSATLNVVMNPVITSGPGGPYYLSIGNVASFSITATGDNLSYQWFKNNTAIAGQTGPSYVRGNVQSVANDQAGYRCRVYNQYTEVYSAFADLYVVVSNPSITQNPASVTGDEGNYFALVCSATIPAAEAPVFFKWYRNGIAINSPRQGNLSPTTDQHVAILGPNTEGGYFCLVTTGYGGSTSSSAATVTSIPPPPPEE